MLVGMPSISRGFRGRREHVDPGRVPPGQHVVRDFPVPARPTPHTPLGEWSFTISGAVRDAVSCPWKEFVDLPAETITVDPGFWKRYGYHGYGDRWRDQRHRGD
jgi:DMSO/TMAO reductase YedYZ molybdopterin-dependent catalytic subunit